VLRTACRQAAAWVKKGIPLQRIAVNFSVNELTHPNFLKMIRRVLSETALEPQLLEIEITESVFVGNEGILAVLNALKDMRLRIAIDDFGTGYSNLFRLKEMPIDCLKIDRSFLNTCGVDGRMKDGAIICAIIAMAQAMDLRVIAEGVETTEQADFLKEKHCQEVQGYLFSRPMSTQQVESYFQRLALSKTHNGQRTTQ
jgi:EAL domain-containing protein (putative c-di-GMP-specific phosphodiesterase class I)